MYKVGFFGAQARHVFEKRWSRKVFRDIVLYFSERFAAYF